MTAGQSNRRWETDGRRAELTVATLNLYVGADLTPVFLAATAMELQDAVARTLAAVVATDFPARATTLARLIAAARPEIIGLQEAAVWQDLADAGYLPCGRLDYLGILLAALQAAGVAYKSVVIGPSTPVASPAGAWPAIRFTNNNVILVRDGNGSLAVGAAQTAHFMTNLVIPTPQLGPISITRGWASVDADLNGYPLRFVATHLEDSHAAVQQAQAGELVGLLAAVDRPVILVGDFNAVPTEASPTYTTLTAAGLTDVWALGGGASPGNTCCQAPDLRNASSTLADRIDWMMIRGSIEVLDVVTFGDLPDNRTQSGLWPSDHAGVAARLSLG